MTQKSVRVIALSGWLGQISKVIEEHGPEAKDTLAERFKQAAFLSRSSINDRYDGMTEMIARARQQLDDAERAYADEQSDDPKIYAERDEARDEGEQNIDVWRGLSGSITDDEFEALGLATPFPSEQKKQVAYAQTVYDRAVRKQ